MFVYSSWLVSAFFAVKLSYMFNYRSAQNEYTRKDEHIFRNSRWQECDLKFKYLVLLLFVPYFNVGHIPSYY